MYVIRAI